MKIKSNACDSTPVLEFCPSMISALHMAEVLVVLCYGAVPVLSSLLIQKIQEISEKDLRRHFSAVVADSVFLRAVLKK